jgi:feruloyl-CoA synthase
VVIAGRDRAEVTALLVPDLEACRRVCGDHPASDHDLLRSARLRRCLQEHLDDLALGTTGSSNRVARALLLAEPLSLDANEVTDKGTFNQGAVLARRAHLVEELYARPYSSRVLVAAARR